MKKNYLLLALVLSLNCFAQTQKNNWVVGTSSTLGFNSSQYDYNIDYDLETKNKLSQFNVNVTGGYFVINNLAVGLDVSYTNSVSTLDSYRYDFSGSLISYKQKTKGNSISMIPFVSYYFANDSKFYPYLSAGLGFNSSKYKYYSEANYDSNKNDAFIWNAKAGVSYLISKQVALDLGLSYNQTKYNEDHRTDKVNDFGVNIGLKLFL